MHQKVDLMILENEGQQIFNFQEDFRSTDNTLVVTAVVEWALQQPGCVNDADYVRKATKAYFNSMRVKSKQTDEQANLVSQRKRRTTRITKVVVEKARWYTHVLTSRFIYT